MLLAPAKKIADQLGFSADMYDAMAAFTAALHAATPILAGRMDSDFGRGEITDVFFAETAGFETHSFASTQFRLSHGFVSKIEEITAGHGQGAERPRAIHQREVTTFAPTLDKDRGIVTQIDTRFRGQMVSIRYTKGFEEHEVDDEPTYKDVPNWLSQAAILQALVLLQGNAVLTQAEIRLDTRMHQAQLDAMVQSKVRYAPAALLPA